MDKSCWHFKDERQQIWNRVILPTCPHRWKESTSRDIRIEKRFQHFYLPSAVINSGDHNNIDIYITRRLNDFSNRLLFYSAEFIFVFFSYRVWTLICSFILSLCFVITLNHIKHRHLFKFYEFEFKTIQRPGVSFNLGKYLHGISSQNYFICFINLQRFEVYRIRSTSEK